MTAAAGAAPCAVFTSELCDEGFRELAAIGAYIYDKIKCPSAKDTFVLNCRCYAIAY